VGGVSSYDKASKPHYELGIDIIDKITDILKEKYSNYYSALTELKEIFSEDPKREVSSAQMLDTETIDKITKTLRKND
jgi:hypothetical protein